MIDWLVSHVLTPYTPGGSLDFYLWNICWLAPEGAPYLTPLRNFLPSIRSNYSTTVLHPSEMGLLQLLAGIDEHFMQSSVQTIWIQKKYAAIISARTLDTRKQILDLLLAKFSNCKVSLWVFYGGPCSFPVSLATMSQFDVSVFLEQIIRGTLGGCLKFSCTAGATSVERVLNSGGCVSSCQTLTPVTP